TATPLSLSPITSFFFLPISFSLSRQTPIHNLLSHTSTTSRRTIIVDQGRRIRLKIGVIRSNVAGIGTCSDQKIFSYISLTLYDIRRNQKIVFGLGQAVNLNVTNIILFRNYWRGITFDKRNAMTIVSERANPQPRSVKQTQMLNEGKT
ncbi:hypothetical protein M8C21_028705, partial [Ambrosia artemisiifolia]